jgi:hypothetical protein
VVGDSSRCSCGAALNPDNRSNVCAECRWRLRSSAALGGGAKDGAEPREAPPAPGALSCDVVDERAGLLNVVNVLPTRVPDAAPVVTFEDTLTGRYRVSFDFSPKVTAILKTLPPAVRRWRGGQKCWEVSADWAGPAAAALRNASVTVRGLTDTASWWCLAPVSITQARHRAYLEGRCVVCTRTPHRAGDLRCEQCHHNRVTHQHHVHAVLADQGLAPWPTATPSAGEALRCRYPLWALEDDTTAISAPPDYTGAADAVLSIARAESAPSCPVCDRKPAKSAPFHVGCRRNLLATLVDKPLSKPRNRAFQDGLCVACRARPHLPGGICCADCARLMQLIRDRFAKQEGEQP